MMATFSDIGLMVQVCQSLFKLIHTESLKTVAVSVMIVILCEGQLLWTLVQ